MILRIKRNVSAPIAAGVGSYQNTIIEREMDIYIYIMYVCILIVQ